MHPRFPCLYVPLCRVCSMYQSTIDSLFLALLLHTEIVGRLRTILSCVYFNSHNCTDCRSHSRVGPLLFLLQKQNGGENIACVGGCVAIYSWLPAVRSRSLRERAKDKSCEASGFAQNLPPAVSTARILGVNRTLHERTAVSHPKSCPPRVTYRMSYVRSSSSSSLSSFSPPFLLPVANCCAGETHSAASGYLDRGGYGPRRFLFRR